MNSPSIPKCIENKNNDTTPLARSGHTMNIIDGYLQIFFGKSNTVYLSDVQKCCVQDNSQIWSKIAKGKKDADWPLDRASHSTVVNPAAKLIVLFGGGQIKPRNLLFNDTYQFNPTTNKFNQVKLTQSYKQILPGRFGHSSCIHGNKLQIFFGYGDKLYYNEIYTLNLILQIWKKEDTCGMSPSPRYKHAFFHSKEFQYISSGMNDKVIFNDIHRFNLNTHSWLKVETKGHLRAKFSHSMYVDRGSNIVIYGGTSNMTSDSLELSNVFEQISGKTITCLTQDKFHPLNSCFTAMCHDQASVWMQGGLNDNQERVNHLYCMNVQEGGQPFIDVIQKCLNEQNGYRLLNCDLELRGKDGYSVYMHSYMANKTLNLDVWMKIYNNKRNEFNMISIETDYDIVTLKYIKRQCYLRIVELNHFYQDTKKQSKENMIFGLLEILGLQFDKNKLVNGPESKSIYNQCIEQLIYQTDKFLIILNQIQTKFIKIKQNLIQLSHYLQDQIINNYDQELIIKDLDPIPKEDLLQFSACKLEKDNIFNNFEITNYDISQNILSFYQSLEENNSSKDVQFQYAQDIKARSNKKESIKIHSVIVSFQKNQLNQAVSDKTDKQLKNVVVMSEIEWKDAELMIKRMYRFKSLDGLKNSDYFGLDWQ